jgi:hypothetical protein
MRERTGEKERGERGGGERERERLVIVKKWGETERERESIYCGSSIHRLYSSLPLYI